MDLNVNLSKVMRMIGQRLYTRSFSVKVFFEIWGQIFIQLGPLSPEVIFPWDCEYIQILFKKLWAWGHSMTDTTKLVVKLMLSSRTKGRRQFM